MILTTSLYSVIQQFHVHQTFVFYIDYCDLKEKYHIRRNLNCQKKKVIFEISIIIILICQNLGSVQPVQ